MNQRQFLDLQRRVADLEAQVKALTEQLAKRKPGPKPKHGAD